LVVRAELQVVFVMLCVLTFAGAFGGLVLGVALELVFGKDDSAGGKKRRPPREKP
jgi:hypothetical protein